MEVNDAAQAEKRQEMAGLGVEGHQVVAGSDQKDGAAALHVGVGRVDRYRGAPLARHRVEPLADLDRRAP